MWSMWRDKLPVATFCCQEILDPRHLGWTLKHVVDLLELVGGALEIGSVVGIDDPQSSSTCDKCLKAARNASMVRLVTTSM